MGWGRWAEDILFRNIQVRPTGRPIKTGRKQPLGYRCLSYSRSCLKVWELLERLGLGLLLFHPFQEQWKLLNVEGESQMQPCHSLLSHLNNYVRRSMGSDQPHILPNHFPNYATIPCIERKIKKGKNERQVKKKKRELLTCYLYLKSLKINIFLLITLES